MCQYYQVGQCIHRGNFRKNQGKDSMKQSSQQIIVESFPQSGEENAHSEREIPHFHPKTFRSDEPKDITIKACGKYCTE